MVALLGEISQEDFRFAVSYGDPQIVQVLVARSLGDVTLKYQVNNGAVQSVVLSELTPNETERFGGPGDVYYHVVRGQVTGTQPGNSVKVWFEGGGQVSDLFTYTAKGCIERPGIGDGCGGLYRHLTCIQEEECGVIYRIT